MTEKTRSACGQGRDADLHIRPDVGQPDLNEPLFRSTEQRLRELGHEVFNPCNLPKTLSYRHAMKFDVAWICDHADAILVLPHWFESPGAKVEIALAKAIGIEVFFNTSQLPLTAAPTEPVTNMFGDGATMEEDFGR